MREIKQLPKIELHCHLDGSMRPSTIFDLLMEKGLDIPVDNKDDFKSLVSVDDSVKSLIDYLKCFDYPIQVLQDAKSITRVTYELIEDLYKDNVKYAEIRFAPSHHTKEGLSLDEVIDACLDGIKLGERDFPITINLIASLMRHLPVDRNIEVVNVASKYMGKGLVAIDLAGNEADFPPKIHKAAFDLAKEYGFNITVHAGETGNFKNIDDAITYLHATRIGHGFSAINSIETIKLLKEKNVTLEVCPTSNLDTQAIDSMIHHPILDLLSKDLSVTVNTDNITVSNITLTNEVEKLVKTFSLDMKQYRLLYTNAVNAAFTDLDTKKKLMDYLKKA